MIRRPFTVAAIGVAGLLALAACGTDDSEPVVRAEQPAAAGLTPFEAYYEMTHPEPNVQPRRPVLHMTTGDAKDHPGYGAVPEFQGDVKDHPRYRRSRSSVNAQIAAFADQQGLTGLSPAFLQPIKR